MWPLDNQISHEGFPPDLGEYQDDMDGHSAEQSLVAFDSMNAATSNHAGWFVRRSGVENREWADDAIQRMELLQMAALNAGCDVMIDPNVALQMAAHRQIVELQLQHAYEREMRGYQYDHYQLMMDRDIQQQLHKEAMHAAREDKDWWTKVQHGHDAVKSAWYRSFVFSLLIVLALDMLGRGLAVYKVWSSPTLSIQDILCYGGVDKAHGAAATGRNETGSFSFEHIDRFGQAMFPTPSPAQAPSSCPKIAVLRLATIGMFYAVLWLATSLLQTVAKLSDSWLQVVGIAAHVVALRSNGWLPTTIIAHAVIWIVASYSILYIMIAFEHSRYVRQVCSGCCLWNGVDQNETDGAFPPSAAMVHQRIMCLHDASIWLQALPIVVGALFAAATVAAN